MHMGSKRTRGDRVEGWKDLHNRAISPSIWSCVYNLPSSFFNTNLSVRLTYPMPPTPKIPKQSCCGCRTLSAHGTICPVSVRRRRWLCRTCGGLYRCLSAAVCVSWRKHSVPPPWGINQASAAWPRWLRPSWASADTRVAWPPTWGGTQKQEE